LISLGDSNSYLLSTGENELGVVVAYSEAGILIFENLHARTVFTFVLLLVIK
jgi:exosome complex RNA-binding protein Csl4